MKSSLVYCVAIAVFCLTGGAEAQVRGQSCTEDIARFFPDPARVDCNGNYFRCRSNVWTLYRCASELVFDSSTQLCVFPSELPSCTNPDPSPGVKVPIPQTQCVMPCARGFDAVYPKLSATGIDCTGYYYCVDGRLYEGFCASTGDGFRVFDSFSRSCSDSVDPFNFNCRTSGL